MKKTFQLIFFFSILLAKIYSQDKDSLVIFSDLKFHSEFERIALSGFINQKQDTFNLFLAVDEKMQTSVANKNYNYYLKLCQELNENKIESKSINKKIKIAYSAVHGRFLIKYNDGEMFPEIFQSGSYNCVTASILYALVFNKLKIPYKVMASSDHVYLIANPGANSIVIETTNPNFQNAIFTGEFKQQYVNYLRNSKIISESEYKTKSVAEIFEAKFNEVNEAEFINLPGFQYYNLALTKFNDNKYEEAVELSKKAYFFYPVDQVKTLLYTALLFEIEKCNFEKITDIDYLAQISRFENTEVNFITGLFNNIISHYLKFTDKEEYCNSLYQRLLSQITDQKTKDEISFSFNMRMSYQYLNSSKVQYYIENALKIKGNYKDAIQILESCLQKKLMNINNSYALIDTVEAMKGRYTFEGVIPFLQEYEMIGYLKIAYDEFNANKLKTGEIYLRKFEDMYTVNVENTQFNYWIENAYYSLAHYWLRKNDKNKVKSISVRGLKYVPESDLLQYNNLID